jgi:hypothetical protein
MTSREEMLVALAAAAELAHASLVVRAGDAIAEVRGPLVLRRGAEWLSLGEESASHVHLKLDAVRGLRFRSPRDANAALEVLGPDGASLCRISFRGTNPSRTDAYEAERAEEMRARFGSLAASEGA